MHARVRPIGERLRGSGSRWGPIAQAFHWISALLVVGLLVVGFVMTRWRFDLATTFELYQAHKSYGLLALMLVLARLAWRGFDQVPAPPASMRPLERRLARIVHAALYVLLVALPVSGWLMASASPLRLPTRPFNLFAMPDLVPPGPVLFARLRLLHVILSDLLVAALALHVAGALKHHFRDRDDVLRRMLPARHSRD
ncbi:cytochrome b [Chelatococcus sp. SYSU_G07232]|uniref:Cytochrome b n=1 Tax=Chelatococcus albus TaxID=3047466 RepID=A0ABT7AL70_9HYPH|nr:cytochrome b [Chelatococcus sp. SYSU_G07232]MDJ1160127.1 cytochrome b [Chelatococcus sp. SYSU_G07232]